MEYHFPNIKFGINNVRLGKAITTAIQTTVAIKNDNDSLTYTNPKSRKTIPPMVSSLFTRFPPRISDCRFQIFPRSHAGAWERDKTKDDYLNQSIPNVRFGSHKAISGQKITNITTTTVDNINSQPSLTKSQSEHLKIVQTI